MELRKSKQIAEIQKEELGRKEQRLQNVITATQTGVWEWNIKTGALDLNQRFAGMLGYSLTDMDCGKMDDWRKFVDPEDVHLLDKAMRQALAASPTFFDAKYRMHHKNGDRIWVNTKGKVMQQSQEGAPLVMYGTQTDITEAHNNQIEIERVKNNLNVLLKGGKRCRGTQKVNGVYSCFRGGNRWCDQRNRCKDLYGVRWQRATMTCF